MKTSIVTMCVVLLGCVLGSAVCFGDGDVRVRSDNTGRLEMIGDANGNSVSVTAIRRGRFFVVGQDGTSINGAKAGQFSGVTSIDIRLNDGEDSVRVNGRGIDNVLENSLRISTGNDGDQVTLDDFDGNSIEVLMSGFGEQPDEDRFVSRNVTGSGTFALFTGKDRDEIVVETALSGNSPEFRQGIIVDSGRGTLEGDQIELVGVRCRLNVITSEGRDEVSIHSTVSLYPFSCSTGGGNDEVVLRDVTMLFFEGAPAYASLNIDLGAGSDRLIAEETSGFAGLRLQGRSGNDQVAIYDCTFANLDFDAGSDNDSLYLSGSVIDGRSLNGGSGYDTIYSQQSGAFGRPTAFNWEIIRFN